MSKTSNTDVNAAVIGHFQIDMETRSSSVPRGVLRISSEKEDRRILGGLKLSQILASIFWG